jgi:hypothetical protein
MLASAGWRVVRTSGGHAIWVHPSGRGVLTIPLHSGAYRGRHNRAVARTERVIRRALARTQAG